MIVKDLSGNSPIGFAVETSNPKRITTQQVVIKGSASQPATPQAGFNTLWFNSGTSKFNFVDPAGANHPITST